MNGFPDILLAVSVTGNIDSLYHLHLVHLDRSNIFSASFHLRYHEQTTFVSTFSHFTTSDTGQFCADAEGMAVSSQSYVTKKKKSKISVSTTKCMIMFSLIEQAVDFVFHCSITDRMWAAEIMNRSRLESTSVRL